MKKSDRLDTVRLAEALERYAKKFTVRGGNYLICCPWHDDSDPSCTIFVPSGIFFCWSCHAQKTKGKKGVPLLKGLETLGVPADERKLIAQGSVYDSLAEEETFERPHSLEESESHHEVDEREFITRETRPWPSNWMFRGVRPDFLALWSASLSRLNSEHLPRLEIPLPNDGPSVFVRLADSVMPKVLNAPNLHKRATVPFGTLPANWKLQKHTKGIILVEGAYDALNLSQHIYDKFGTIDAYVVVGLLGVGGWTGHFKQKFLDHILGQYSSRKDLKLYVASDADDAGDALSKTIVKDLVDDGWYLPKKSIHRITFPRGVKDPGDLSFEQFEASIVPQLVNP